MSAPTLQEQLDAAINARQRILTSGQELSVSDMRKRSADLAQVNKTIASLQAQLANATAAAAGRPSASLSFATVDFGCRK